MVKRGIGGWGVVLALGMGLAAVSAAPVANSIAGQIPQEALRLAGPWDITVHTSWGEAYSWLEVEPSGATLFSKRR